MKPSLLAVGCILVVLLAFIGVAAAADEVSEDDMKQANNPLADFRTFNIHNYWVPEVSGTDETANTMWLRYAQPAGNWLIRASLPLQRATLPGDVTASGLGYSNIFGSYLFDTGVPSTTVGLGPFVGIPATTGNVPAPTAWSAGLAGVVFDARSSFVQWGGLVTWQSDFGGSSNSSINLLAIQPFGLLQLGGGNYLRSVGIWTFNLDSGDYSVPVGFGIGRVMRTGNLVLNFFVEPQFTVLSHGAGQPEFQVFFGFNIQVHSAAGP